MSDRPRPRLPWEKDEHDAEANYRKPIAQDEKLRLVVKAAAAFAGFLFVMNATQDGTDVGAEFLIGIGAPVLLAGVLDLVWTLGGRLEHVFIESRPFQIAAHAAMAVIGGALLVAGVVARAT